jgi:hypothetical protein
LEEFFVREHRQARRARRFVFFRDAHGIEVGTDDASGRRGLLHLRNERDVTHARRAKRAKEVAPPVALQHGIAQVSRSDGARGELGDFEALLGNDGVEDVGHG